MSRPSPDSSDFTAGTALGTGSVPKTRKAVRLGCRPDLGRGYALEQGRQLGGGGVGKGKEGRPDGTGETTD
jgi:hypothetical protein